MNPLINESTVEFSTILIFILSTILAIFLTQNYFQKRTRSYLFWSLGLWCFSVGVVEEILFAFGYYSGLLIDSYLVIVALLVQFLALGSLQLVKSRRAKAAYSLYSIVGTVAIVALFFVTSVGNVVQNYVVYGNLPLSVVIVSSLITFPVAAIIVATAALSYKKSKSYKMLSIIAGVVTVSIAGSLYIVQFPAFLYYSEFAGILLLWLGFFSLPKKSTREELQPSPENSGMVHNRV
jgi:hypothetical protein